MGKANGLEGRRDVDEVLSSVSSDKVDTRTKGLKELVSVVRDDARRSKKQQISDRGYHTILESLFRGTKYEITYYTRATKSSASKAESRLATCGSLVRTIVETQYKKLGPETVEALLEHVRQSLPTADSGYCNPLVFDYVRTLVCLFEYKPHVENLTSEEAQGAVDFCLDLACDLSKVSDEQVPHGSLSTLRSTQGHRSRTMPLDRSATPSVAGSHNDSFSKDSSQRMEHPSLQSSAAGIVACLQHLSSAPNAPVLEKSDDMLAILFNLLQSHPSVNTIQQPAFEAINSLIPRILTNKIELSLRTMRRFIALVPSFWQTRASGLKEVLLSIFLHGELLLPLLISKDETGNCTAELAAVVDVFRQEYCERRQKELLLIEDVDLSEYSRLSLTQPPLRFKHACIRLGAIKAEEPWSLLRISASIIVSLDQHSPSTVETNGGDELDHRSKRQRLTKQLEEISRLIRSTRLDLKVYGLQVLAFIFERHILAETDLLDLIEILNPSLSDEDGTIASWAMFAITCAATQASARRSHLKEIWLRTWRLVFRQISFFSTCKTACHLSAVLLDTGIIEYSDVADLIDAMITSPDLNGPAECDGAATQLWHVVLSLRAQENLSSVTAISGAVISWLFKRWNPSAVSDRLQVMYRAQQASIFGILRLLCTSLGCALAPPNYAFSQNLGRLSQALVEALRNQRLIHYLVFDGVVLHEKAEPKRDFKSQSSNDQIIGSSSSPLATTAFDLLASECSHLYRDCFSDLGNTASSINVDVVHVASSLCIIGFALLSEESFPIHERGETLRKALNKLRVGLKNCLLQHERRKELLEGLVGAFGALSCPMDQLLPGQNLLMAGAIFMSQEFDSEFWKTATSVNKTTNGVEGSESMDLDMDFGSQTKQERTKEATSDLIHIEIPAATSPESYKVSCIARVCFMSMLTKPFASGGTPESSVSSSFINYVTEMKRQDFLLCRFVLRDFLKSGMPLTEDDADTLLQYLSQTYTQRYETRRSEVAIGTCLEIMTDLAVMWTSASSECAGAGAELYIWFLDEIMGGDLPSTHVHDCAAALFQTIIRIRPDYGRDLSLASARTSLFEVLSKGSLVVKFNIGNDISSIFGLFVLKEHDQILNDVMGTLPSDPSWIEGIALRLFILARLAASWSTLLRRCIYAIFETPAQVRPSAGYAKHCLTYVSISLNLTKSQDLFKLFASQIIYTWLVEEPLGSIPYSIFEYQSLKSMLEDVQDEVIGQIVMRGKEDEATQVAENLSIPFETLLDSSFAKATSYSIAWDIAIPPDKRPQPLGAEARLRKALGKERYASLVTMHFAEIVALFYTTMDNELHIEKQFQKRPAFSAANDAYHEMTRNSASTKTLPPNQQPSFPARYLIDEIEYLCRRTSYDAERMWTPTLYVYVFRRLLGFIQPAFGSLHACSALRKIRILIAMAGTIALEQYPLEMALHALKPFLTETQCAEDAVGIFQYLVAHGSAYLEEVPSFLVGNAATTLISMRAFLDSTQDSTTQESQFRTTLTKARTLHAWFAAYLSKYTSAELSDEAMESFKRIVRTASKISNRSNAREGTYESELLLQIFEDQRSGRELLSSSSRASILTSLCRSFEIPPDFRQDILGNEELATLYAPFLWKSCLEGVTDPNYLLWCGRVMGRAYAGEGHIDKTMILEASSESDPKAAQQQTSHMKILLILCALLQSTDQNEVGIAETTLRSIVTAAHGTRIFTEYEQVLPSSLIKAMFWSDHCLPKTAASAMDVDGLDMGASVGCWEGLTTQQWIRQFAIALANTAENDPMLSALPLILETVKGISEKVFPYVLHLVLLKEAGGQQKSRAMVSDICRRWFQTCLTKSCQETSSVQILLKAILYLHTQAVPHESVKADRWQWLEIDYKRAAMVAARCSMYKTSLLFLEIDRSEQMKSEGISAKRDSRRKTQESTPDASDVLLDIYQHVDEQDAFYGVKQPSSLLSMMNQLEYEHAGFKSLSFRGAYYDGQIRQASGDSDVDAESMVRALDRLDLNGLSQSMLSKAMNTGVKSVDAALHTARKLEKWDISAPSTHQSPTCATFRVFQNLNTASDAMKIDTALQAGFSDLMNQLLAGKAAKSSMHSTLASLAILTETDEIFSSRGSKQLEDVLCRLEARNGWMEAESFDRVNAIISCRDTLFSSLCKKQSLQDIVKITLRDARMFEARVLLASSQMSRGHNALQNALTTATYLNQTVKPCQDAGVEISAAVRFESAHVLWGQGEMTASIRMLQDLERTPIPKSEVLRPGRAELLAKLGHQISEARLEKPDEIIKSYLTPAIKALGDATEGPEAGEVFHEFAFFCDQQLQNPDSLEDFQRIKKLRDRKVAEVQEIEVMIKKASSQGKEKDNLRSHRNKAKLWLDLDDREYQRLRDSRQTFLRQSIENYLLCLKASDRFDNDALRFSALWLENHDSDIANAAVAKHIGQVGSRKFALLMNQWSSRLLDNSSQFQQLLFQLVLRICLEHPYHGMYQIFASSKSKGGKDETALARFAAAGAIVEKLKSSKRVSQTWVSLHNTNVNFVRFATERLADVKPGAKVQMRSSSNGQRIEQEVNKYHVPPPTMTIPLRPDCDYSSVPTIARFQVEFTMAGGNSAPKIITAVGTDGLKYKQLLKGGNDDLRQDAIMEQVFAAVSSVLATQRSTHQRALKIRTYKVLPLTATAGIIEFVPNTVPLHDYLLPAHQRHFPRDLKPNVCRKYIEEVQSSSVDARIKTFRRVTQQFHPVLRYFFFERFQSPDTWFDTRLAYTRSTAAISVLGHVLGLGDRHGHNILLDEITGEVVHIDLGIAFEQGRVLPIPEVVPFRLTRDLVDAMGCTETEGVFRRCCEFTLEALRNESYSIMTILDVLRYDPLYSWSLSPLRVKKMQEQGDEGGGVGGRDGEVGDGEVGKKAAGDNEPGEADRALMVVKKKLSKSLSVQATVNELISAATDERNLAVLFCGWAAYA